MPRRVRSDADGDGAVRRNDLGGGRRFVRRQDDRPSRSRSRSVAPRERGDRAYPAGDAPSVRARHTSRSRAALPHAPPRLARSKAPFPAITASALQEGDEPAPSEEAPFDGAQTYVWGTNVNVTDATTRFRRFLTNYETEEGLPVSHYVQKLRDIAQTEARTHAHARCLLTIHADLRLTHDCLFTHPRIIR
jgi:hypothetical protein